MPGADTALRICWPEAGDEPPPDSRGRFGGDDMGQGSLPGLGVHVNDIVGVVPTADGKGYFLVGADGGVFTFGDAPFYGSLPGLGVHVDDIVGVVPTRG